MSLCVARVNKSEKEGRERESYKERHLLSFNNKGRERES
jgi:hypothetical protein